MHKITHDLAPKQFIDIFQKTLSSQIITYEALAQSSLCLNPKINILEKVLVTEGQNCGIASQKS